MSCWGSNCLDGLGGGAPGGAPGGCPIRLFVCPSTWELVMLFPWPTILWPSRAAARGAPSVLCRCCMRFRGATCADLRLAGLFVVHTLLPFSRLPDRYCPDDATMFAGDFVPTRTNACFCVGALMLWQMVPMLPTGPCILIGKDGPRACNYCGSRNSLLEPPKGS